MKSSTLASWALVALVTCCCFAGSASAALVETGDTASLADLIDNDGVYVVGDKQFSNFNYGNAQVTPDDMPSASGISVIGLVDDDGNYGIRFRGYFSDSAFSQGGSDAAIEFDVDVLDEDYEISGVMLAGNPNVLGDAGAINVTEDFLPLGANGEYTLSIYDDRQGAGLQFSQLMDSVYFNEPEPITSLHVYKDIGALAYTGYPSVTLSRIDQVFYQEPIRVPEPAGYALLSLMGAVVVGLRYRLG
ncbi:hypothetical protein [Aeoliella mucimassa]|uniref:PEP-CTERM protein-sorting domain-containing protein n=1 Tax=Aeoliella mucimassa TaxID=2527972 RepID=A0A518AV78_9BACT|nr:hypothetical protein [Aeoliella mucimassa]QDU58635.1 hypothetical protein Pan181_48740 [Aeoliella mucimassa]